MTPDPKSTSSDRAARGQLGETALVLWMLAVLLGEFMLTCWWFGQMYST